jgi:hypothetical protein
MKIKNVKITELKDDIVVAGRYSATGIPDKEYKG